MKPLKFFLTAVTMGLALAGCTVAGTQSDDGSLGASTAYLPEMQTAAELRFKDLPLPAGYTYRPDKSMILEYGDVQAGIMLYDGPGDPAELIGYFRREMPKFEWRMVNMIERKETVMIFEKTGKTCQLTIYPSGLSKKASVQVYYAPKQ